METEVLWCTEKLFSWSPQSLEYQEQWSWAAVSLTHSGDNVFCLQALGGSHRAGHALDQSTAPSGLLGVSEVTQLCSATGGFHSEISFTPCGSLKEIGMFEKKGKDSHVPITTVRLCCQLLPSGEGMHRFQEIYCSWDHAFLDWHKDRLTRFYQQQKLKRSHHSSCSVD